MSPFVHDHPARRARATTPLPGRPTARTWHGHKTRGRAWALAGVMVCAGAAAADDPPAPRGDRPRSPPAAQAESEPKCVHGCQRWGEFCNVDPRGVYRCQRRCEKFGEICE